MSAEKYKSLKVKDLQELLQKNGLSQAGKKEELVDRLVKHDEQTAREFANLEEEFGDLEEFDESKVNLDDLSEKPIDDLAATEIDDIADDPLEPVKNDTPETEKKEETEKKAEAEPAAPVTKPNSNFKFTPITFDKSPSAPVEKKSVPPVKPIISKPADSAAAAAAEKKQKDDAEKALERAKRFGIQLNETAKKDIRAQRFGIAAKTETKPVNKGIDPEVLKKRAERFGISDDAAAVASTKGKVPVKFDAAEEDKKRKRAERFGLEAAAASKKQKAE